MRIPAPLANGIRTDHPVPGLPFVDDSLLPLDDQHAIEKIGRRSAPGTWGREDSYSKTPGAWRAFTTDPTDNDFAWVVMRHPDRGTTVLLYRDDDAVTAYSYMDYTNGGIMPLIVRAGGYWSDGNVWLRPTQTLDPVTGDRTWDRPASAHSVTAEDALTLTDGKHAYGHPFTLNEIANGKATTVPYTEWVSTSLRVWADNRDGDSLPLGECILDIQAPELAHYNLLNNSQAAELAEVGASTWRAYVSRGTAPSPQNGWTAREERPSWSRPIVLAWIARRDRDDSERPLPALDDYAAPVVNEISAGIQYLGRRGFKSDRAAQSVKFALEERVIGLATHPYIPAEMHASWLADEFTPSYGGELSSHAGDQIVSLMWLDPRSAEQALQSYISKGIERGYSREALEHSLTDIEQVRGSETYSALVKRAISPHWGE